MDTLNNPDGLQNDGNPVDLIEGILASSDTGVTEDFDENDPNLVKDGEEDEVRDNGPDDEEDSHEEGEDDSSEEDDDDDAGDNDGEDDENLFTVKINGEERQVTLEELKKSYQLDGAITQKSQAVSAKEKQLDEHLNQVAEIRQQQVNALEQLKTVDQIALEELDKTNWDELKELDPEQFMLKREERRELQDKIASTQRKQAELIEENQQRQVEIFNKAKEAAQEVLSGPEGIPGWTDENQGPVIRDKIRDFGEKMGFSSDELKYLIDPRALKILHMAAEFAELKSKGKDIADKKVRKNPKNIARSGDKKPKGKADELKEKAKKAQQSGSIDDAADFLMNLPNF